MTTTTEPPLDTARHIRYWQRCLRTLLPHHYTTMDSTRLSLGFFIICSIDLLTPPSSSPAAPKPPPLLTPTDRAHLRRWVLSCQHPAGGFTGSPTHVLAPHHQSADRGANAHIGGTYFALLLLALLAPSDSAADSAFAGVDRAATLRWLRRLQRPGDGSFGEIAYDDGGGGETVVAGGRDMRYSYLAAAVRWMLRGPDDEEHTPRSHPDYVDDIDVPALVAHIRRGQTYDGGFAESAAHESHAGYAYCAVAALALLDRPPLNTTTTTTNSSSSSSSAGYGSEPLVAAGIPDRAAFVKWLASRQFAYTGKDDDDDNDDDDNDNDPQTANSRLADLTLTDGSTTPTAPAQHIGFNGRCNKVADTCYTWWTLGALAALSLPAAVDPDPAALRAQRQFLLQKTQHVIGGFGKHPGSPPDVGHASLGLAALATMGDPALKKLDATLCVSEEAVGKIERARRGLLRRGQGGEGGNGELGPRLVDIAARMQGGKPEWLDAMA